MSDNKQNTIGKEFSMGELIRFVSAPVITRLLVSILSTLDDALFVSRFCGPNALAAFSIGFPLFMAVDAIGMLLSSVSIICSIKMGQKKNDEANSDFTTMILIAFGMGIIFTLLMLLFAEPLLLVLGETEILMPYAMAYFDVYKYYLPLQLILYITGGFYVIAGKPKWSMLSSGINTFCQLFFDYIFIARMNLGIVGAAYANIIGSTLVFLLALYFFSNKEREIHFTKPQSSVRQLLMDALKYGRMQFITSIALAINSYIGNQVQLSIGGEKVVAAYTIVTNVTFMFMNSFFGLIGSTSPIASYAYGEKNPRKLSRICKQTVVLISGWMLVLMAIIFFGRNLVLQLYLTEESSPEIREMAYYGLSIYPMGLMFFGYNVFVQEFMNVVGNNKVSLALSLIENLFFSILFMVLLPRIFGVDGVWYAFGACEFATFFFTLYVAYVHRNVYGYGSKGIATFVNE